MTTWHHPASARRFQPWKNGGGQTAEIAVSPAGAGFDDFDWRISTAIVAQSGPFSGFPGVDRVLTVIEGGAMELTVAGESRHLDAGSDPFAFPGDAPARAVLTGPALLDFNVMVRRPLHASVRRTRLATGGDPGALAHLALLLEDAGGLARLDLIDLRTAPSAMRDRLAGTLALEVAIQPARTGTAST